MTLNAEFEKTDCQMVPEYGNDLQLSLCNQCACPDDFAFKFNDENKICTVTRFHVVELCRPLFRSDVADECEGLKCFEMAISTVVSAQRAERVALRERREIGRQ